MDDDFELPKTLKRNIFNLEVLSKFRLGDQLSTTGGEYLNIEDNTVLLPIKRSIQGDSRYKALDFIITEVESVVDFTEVILESIYLAHQMDKKKSEERIVWLTTIKRRLDVAMHGLINFKDTYKDSQITVKSDDCVKEMKRASSKIQRFFTTENIEWNPREKSE